jgi:hypothetical protein
MNEIQCLAADGVTQMIAEDPRKTTVSLNPRGAEQNRIDSLFPVAMVEKSVEVIVGELRVEGGTRGLELSGVAFEQFPVESIVLRQMMEEAKGPESLRVSDVLAIARTVDSIRRLIDRPCVTTILDASRRSSEYVLSFGRRIDCATHLPSDDPIILVHRYTGIVRDARTGTVLSSPATEALRAEVAARLTRQAQTRTDVIRRRCRLD